MKYIFVTKGAKENESLKSIIAADSDINIKIDLFNGSGESMTSIYDDTTNQISFYNKVSAEKNIAHPAFEIGTLVVPAVLMIIGRIRGHLGLVVEKGLATADKTILRIGDFCAPAPKSEFLDIIKGHNLEKPLYVNLLSNLGHAMYPFLMENVVKKENDFALITMVYNLTGTSKSFKISIETLDIKSILVKDHDSLLGCDAKSFIKSMKADDVKSEVIDCIVHRGGSIVAGKKRIFEDGGRSVCFAVIRSGNDVGVYLLTDYLLATDSSEKLLENMIKALKPQTPSPKDFTVISLPSNKMISNDKLKVYYLPNIFEFKPFRFEIANGRSF